MSKRPVKIAFRMGRMVVLLFGCLVFGVQAHLGVKPSPNGLKIPHDYWDWQSVASSHNTDDRTLVVILGNDVAIEAIGQGNIDPWPDKSVLAKLVWQERKDESRPGTALQGEFLQADFMFKNSKKYADTGGWGWARWKGLEQKPVGEDGAFAKECMACHDTVKPRDYVFTEPAELPR